MSFIAVLDTYGVSEPFLPVRNGDPSEIYANLPADPRIRHISVACTDAEWLGRANVAYNVYLAPTPAVAQALGALGSPGAGPAPGPPGPLAQALLLGNSCMYCGYLASFSPSLTFRQPTRLSLSGSLASAWGGGAAPGGDAPVPGAEGGYSVVLSAIPVEGVDMALPHVPTEAEDALLRVVMDKAMAKLFGTLRAGLVFDGQASYLDLEELRRAKERLARESRYEFFWV